MPRPVPKILWIPVLPVILLGCGPTPSRAPELSAQEALSGTAFAELIDRISEPGGYFDTDNLISNETGYLNVMDALQAAELRGGAYVGVGPDQNFSYIAELRPEIAFIIDVRRDNLLQHLLLKGLLEESTTRVAFLSALVGVEAPVDVEAWPGRSVEEVVLWVDSVWAAPDPQRGDRVVRIQSAVAERLRRLGLELSDGDWATVGRFHRSFVDRGLDLRFTSFGRPPRPYYPTYRQLLLETDADGDQVSYLASAERYDVVRSLQLANRVIPVAGDLSGPHAVREIGIVLEEMGVELSLFYASNVEYYLWQGRTFERWQDNIASLPAAAEALVIRSYFSNFGRSHPSAVPGYYATQTLQPVSVLTGTAFGSYWEVVTKGALSLR